MSRAIIRLPLLVASEILEGYNRWALENRELVEWIRSVEVLQKEYILSWGATEESKDYRLYWALLPSLHQRLVRVLRTFRTIVEVDPAYLRNTGLDAQGALLRTLAKATSRDQLDIAWMGFRTLVLSFHERLLQCYHEAIRALKQHVEVVAAHKLTEAEVQSTVDATSYVRGVIEGLGQLAEDS
ncbi:hypothetical protein JAAARDRAFT_197592 [Jaapia argillacea MUCL 33604]|uniref:Uncharacterized protein n=1 Tax=Jaapia argillacea MUCL 33604 TaxID=933084 RepID=A0A067PEA6_9AGAM|nr:hypothetical protein JAAARDRAFT_197592 [Jaapia argillacea MUCL 33604]